MAGTNKFTSINFNDVYEKQLSSSATKSGSSRPSTAPSSSTYSSASSHYVAGASASSNYKSHLTQGRMLVLTRPTPKPIAVPLPAKPTPDQAPRSVPDSDPISLRPLGRTGAGSSLPSPVPVQEREREVAPSLTSPKPNRFVPPHLRPGFAGREERPEVLRQAVPRGREPVHGQQQQGPHGSPSPGGYGEDQLGRPMSGGYDRMRRGGESDLIRGSSFGNRPSSSG